jgi:hypothetical protein
MIIITKIKIKVKIKLLNQNNNNQNLSLYTNNLILTIVINNNQKYNNNNHQYPNTNYPSPPILIIPKNLSKIFKFFIKTLSHFSILNYHLLFISPYHNHLISTKIINLLSNYENYNLNKL